MNQSKVEFMQGCIDSLQIAVAILVVSKLGESEIQNLRNLLRVIQETEATTETQGPEYKRGAEHTMRNLIENIGILKSHPVQEHA